MNSIPDGLSQLEMDTVQEPFSPQALPVRAFRLIQIFQGMVAEVLWSDLCLKP